MTEVGVLMPVRNGARWLPAALDSILGQTLPSIEVVVVDDGSIDASPGILAAYRARDPRLRVLASPDAGLVAALNHGLMACSARLVARMDCDDIALPDRLAEQAAEMRRRPRLAVLGGSVELIDAAGIVIGRQDYPDGIETVARLVEGPTLAHPAVMLDRHAVLAAGGYRPQYRLAEDYDLWLRLAERDPVSLGNLESLVLRYRIHADGVGQRHAVEQELVRAVAWGCHALRRSGIADPCSDPAEAIDAAMLDQVLTSLEHGAQAAELAAVLLARTGHLELAPALLRHLHRRAAEHPWEPLRAQRLMLHHLGRARGLRGGGRLWASCGELCRALAANPAGTLARIAAAAGRIAGGR